ncbi:hypothetical protein [Hydrogenimonas sp. SS33]|uniref:hypothetical protein n=1 Tax=Hydrogenimonas leucolamina TaxID=2954236 RepID=UPI00336C12FE
MKRLVTIFSIFSLAAALHADSPEGNETAVDRYHKTISQTVVEWSEAIDRWLSGWLGGEANESKKENETGLEEERKETDTFFQTRKYLSETPDAYIRMRGDFAIHSLESDESDVKFRAHLPLSHTQKRFRLFLEDINEENVDNLVKKSGTADNEASPKFGLNYFAPEAYGIDSKYTLGFSSLHPYIRARYNMVFEPDGWAIEPVQTFQYSEKDDFSESTALYFDTRPYDASLFRIELHRGTRAHEKGMAYGAALGYYWALESRSGMRLVQSFAGHTDYEYTPDGSYESRKFSGIYGYTTAFGYRRSVWRKWVYVEGTPAVSFRKRHDFRPDYSFSLVLDIFFGNYR